MTGKRQTLRRVLVAGLGLTLMTGLTACNEGETATTPETEMMLAAEESGEELQLASGDAVTDDERPSAFVTMDIEPVGYLFTEGRHRFTQTRTFTEHSGIGVTLVKGRICVRGGEECVEGQISRRIDAGTELVLQNHYIATPVVPTQASVQYWGVDDNGNSFEVSEELTLALPAQ